MTLSSSAQQHRGRSTVGGECLDRSKAGNRADGAGREGARTLRMSEGVGKGFTMSLTVSSPRTGREAMKGGLAEGEGGEHRINEAEELISGHFPKKPFDGGGKGISNTFSFPSV